MQPLLLRLLSVVLYHIGGQVQTKSPQAFSTRNWYLPLLRLLLNGNRGVELFFVISGFILGRPFARYYLMGGRHVSLPQYYLRRLTRLEPPYVLSLVLFSLAGIIYVHAPAVMLLKHLVVSALYLHQLIYRQASIINGVTWSLELEVQFYLLVPVLVWFYKIRHARARRVSLAAVILFFCFFQRWMFFHVCTTTISILYETVLMYLQFFIAGLLLSDLYLTALPRWRPHWLWDVASLVSWSAFFYLNASWDFFALPPLLIIAFLGAFRGIYFPRFFRVQSIAVIGGMCYSIYLWHFFFIALVFKASKHIIVSHDYLANVLLQSVILLPPVLFLSSLYYFFVERPCMDPQWPQKLAAKWTAAVQRFAAA